MSPKQITVINLWYVFKFTKHTSIFQRCRQVHCIQSKTECNAISEDLLRSIWWSFYDKQQKQQQNNNNITIIIINNNNISETTTTDKKQNQKTETKHNRVYFLESSRRGNSNEYPQCIGYGKIEKLSRNYHQIPSHP